MNPLLLKMWGYGVLALLAVGSVSWIGYQIYNAFDEREEFKLKATHEEAEKNKAIKSISDMIADQQRTHKISEAYNEVKTQIEYRDREVIKKVNVYRDRVVERFVVNDEWVRAYNESTEPMHSENPPAGTDGAPTELRKAVSDADLLDVATSNNRICVKQAEQLKALQDWAKPQ